MKRLLTIILFALISTLYASFVPAQNLDENGATPRATPESVGVSSEALTKAIRQLAEKFDSIDGVMILRDGKVISEAYRAPDGAEEPRALYSLDKTFCSTAVGFAVEEGKLKLDDKLADAFADELPENPDPRLKDVTLEHLLTMSSGQAKDRERRTPEATEDGGERLQSDAKPTWARDFLARKIERAPGSTFSYDAVKARMASAMLQKAVGDTTLDYLGPRLFEPLHIEPIRIETSDRNESSREDSIRDADLFLKTEDVAKFGQLYLQKGSWNGKQILPKEWIENASTSHVSNGADLDDDWAQGYGLQFWRCRDNCYRCDGLYSRFCLVLPDQNAVVAVNSDSEDYAGILDVLFGNLVPAMKSEEPLPENPDALAKLREAEKLLRPKENVDPDEATSRPRSNSTRDQNDQNYDNGNYDDSPNAYSDQPGGGQSQRNNMNGYPTGQTSPYDSTPNLTSSDNSDEDDLSTDSSEDETSEDETDDDSESDATDSESKSEPANPTNARRVVKIEGVNVAFRWISPGSFTMGNDEELRDSNDNLIETFTAHNVAITKGFWLAETETTRRLWAKVMGTSNSGHFTEEYKGVTDDHPDDRPIETVSWDDCNNFINKLNSKKIVSNGKFRLPTEAEWEYACRAGTTDKYNVNDETIGNLAWIFNNSHLNSKGEMLEDSDGKPLHTTHAVAGKIPNKWGLYDMHGNVFEWCSDWYAPYSKESAVDPKGPSAGKDHVLRGGSYGYGVSYCKSVYRYKPQKDDPEDDWGHGFRLLLDAPEK